MNEDNYLTIKWETGNPVKIFVRISRLVYDDNKPPGYLYWDWNFLYILRRGNRY